MASIIKVIGQTPARGRFQRVHIWRVWDLDNLPAIGDPCPGEPQDTKWKCVKVNAEFWPPHGPGVVEATYCETCTQQDDEKLPEPRPAGNMAIWLAILAGLLAFLGACLLGALQH